MRFRKQYQQNGFTLIEVLVSMLLLALGLLSFASLQIVNLKSNRSALYRSYATFQAYDILDCMRVNRLEAANGAYDTTFDEESVADSSTLAGQDLNAWKSTLRDFLPAGAGAITVDETGFATVQIQWFDALTEAEAAPSIPDDERGFMVFTTNTRLWNPEWE
jgi:type IV pilus assembly protein PilV